MPPPAASAAALHRALDKLESLIARPHHDEAKQQKTTLLLAVIGVSLIVICTPGPDTAITIRNTLLGGRAAGVLTALGIAAGQTIWAVATGAGVVALPVFARLRQLRSFLTERD
jgi:hypothetical protein